MTLSIAVIGAGAWGTALAAHLSRRADLAVTLWARDSAQARAMAASRVNEKYLPGCALPRRLDVSSDLAVVATAELLVVATPVAALPAVAGELAAAGARAPLVFRAEQNVLLELAEPATGASTTAAPGWVSVKHRDGQAGYVRIAQVFGL